MSALFALALALVQPQPEGVLPGRRVAPVDQCARDAEFAAYRARLLDAIVRRDVAALRPLVADDIFFSFGGDEGWDMFRQTWTLDRPLDSPLWTILGETLMLGCAARDDSFASPYAFAHWPEFDGVALSYLALPGTELRAAPDYEAPVLAELAWHIVEVVDPYESAQAGWLRVKLGDGRVGYVPTENLRIDIDYRAIFELRDGRWLLTTFIAGD